MFEKKWESILLYGKTVDDFHTIDKDKIWAVGFSALQQVDKNQQLMMERIATLEAQVQQLLGVI